MPTEKIIEKLKEYCENEIKMYESFGESYDIDINKMVDRCYGAVMYSLYLLSSVDSESVGKWWDNEMHPRFRELGGI